MYDFVDMGYQVDIFARCILVKAMNTPECVANKTHSPLELAWFMNCVATVSQRKFRGNM